MAAWDKLAEPVRCAKPVAHSFTLAWGFSAKPLAVLDDSAIIKQRAKLKQRHLEVRTETSGQPPHPPPTAVWQPSPRRAGPPVSRPDTAPPRPGSASLRLQQTTPKLTPRPPQLTRPDAAPPRPGSASPRLQQTTPQLTLRQPQLTRPDAAPPRPGSASPRVQLTTPQLTPRPTAPRPAPAEANAHDQKQREVHAVLAQHAKKLRKDGNAALRRRSEASEKARKAKEMTIAQASERLSAWVGRRNGGRSRVRAEVEARVAGLQARWQQREERIETWQSEQRRQLSDEAEVFASHMEASKERFEEAQRARELALRLAEVRAASRAKAKAAGERTCARQRARELARRERKVQEGRQQLAAERRAQTAALESKISRRFDDLRSFEQSRARAHEDLLRQARAARTGSAEAAPSPREHPLSARAATDAVATPALRHGLERRLQECAMCERQFSVLPGVTYLKAVAEKRANWGDDTLRKFCSKQGLQKMYSQARLCTFCSQFFMEGWTSAGE